MWIQPPGLSRHSQWNPDRPSCKPPLSYMRNKTFTILFSPFNSICQKSHSANDPLITWKRLCKCSWASGTWWGRMARPPQQPTKWPQGSRSCATVRPGETSKTWSPYQPKYKKGHLIKKSLTLHEAMKPCETMWLDMSYITWLSHIV